MYLQGSLTERNVTFLFCASTSSLAVAPRMAGLVLRRYAQVLSILTSDLGLLCRYRILLTSS